MSEGLNSRGATLGALALATPPVAARRLDIGLVNNMPDAAMRAAERQFSGLLFAAAGDLDVRLHLFHAPGVARGPLARSQMRGRYADVARLPDANLDAVIVTGAEPQARDLRDEPYWPDLARLAEWVAVAGLPSIWSCLAAHAAVLAMDGVVRRRLQAKCTGLFAWERIDAEPALSGLPAHGASPHSRHNDLAEEDLVAKGYRILARSRHAGVDMFVKRRGGLWLFLQGHPEYAADSLLREYKRDLGRWAGKGRPAPPVPLGYFPPRLERELQALSKQGRSQEAACRGAGALETFAPVASWRSWATAVFASFLAMVAIENRDRHAEPRVALRA